MGQGLGFYISNGDSLRVVYGKQFLGMRCGIQVKCNWMMILENRKLRGGKNTSYDGI
jgi:hypothetical protein